MTKKKAETKKVAAKKTETKPKAKPTAKERVEVELKELSDKIFSLIDFKESKKYDALSKIQQRLLRIQLLHMTNYADTLKQRLKSW